MEKRCFRMGVDDFLGKQLTEDPKFSGQDDILNAVTDEISNRGFIIGQQISYLIGLNLDLYGQ